MPPSIIVVKSVGDDGVMNFWFDTWIQLTPSNNKI